MLHEETAPDNAPVVLLELPQLAVDVEGLVEVVLPARRAVRRQVAQAVERALRLVEQELKLAEDLARRHLGEFVLLLLLLLPRDQGWRGGFSERGALRGFRERQGGRGSAGPRVSKRVGFSCWRPPL